MSQPLRAVAVVGAVALLFPPAALAGGADTYGAPVSGSDLLQAERADAEGGHLEPFARLSMVYDNDPLLQRNSDGSETKVLEHQLGAHGSFGLALWGRAHVAILLPVYLQAGEGLPNTGSVSGTTLGDVALDLRYALLGRQDPIEFALALRVSAPTAPSGAFVGDDSVSLRPGVLLSREFGQNGPLINGGLRTTLETSDSRTSSGIGSALELTTGGLLPVADHWALCAEGTLSSEYEHFLGSTTTPASFLGGVRYHTGTWVAHLGAGPGVSRGLGTPDYRIAAMVGTDSVRSTRSAGGDGDADGISNPSDRCPAEPEDHDGDRDDDGCPDLDRDQDGIVDAADACASAAEDMDGFEDADGCPEQDNDQDGIADPDDRCPTEAEDLDTFQDGDGCPDLDNDGDTIVDASDACPTDAEDADGWLDTDGCPEADNDDDGIPDAADQCPKEKETPNGVDDSDGCPDLLRVENAQIRTMEPVYFEYNSDRIQARSAPLLQEMAALIISRSDLGVIAIEGHTDSRGADGFNLELSKRRAKTVRAFLVEQGVPEDRLTADGFGESRAIASNETQQGREQNRRVEFRLAGTSSAPNNVSGEGL